MREKQTSAANKINLKGIEKRRKETEWKKKNTNIKVYILYIYTYIYNVETFKS